MASQTIPGPKGRLFLGNLREFQADTLGFLRNLSRYGDLTMFRFGPFPAHYISHPDYIHQVLVSDAAKMHKSRTLKREFRRVTGEGIFISDGEFWKKQRKQVQPAFHSKRIGAYADVIVDYAQQMVSQWHSGQTREAHADMVGLTMRVIAKTLFDAEMDTEVSEISSAITQILEVVNKNTTSLLTAPHWVPTADNRKLKAGVARLDALIHRFIDERRQSGEDKGDLLSMLLLARDEEGRGMTDKQVRDEAMTLFGAGHETTAVTLSWALYLLSQHPEAAARLRAEVDSVLGSRRAALDDLGKLTYTEMVIKEAMRLYPPAWGTSRELIDDITIGGHTIKKGNVIIMSFQALHRDPRWWTEPDRFLPERFAPENEKSLHKFAYLPFGAGPRVCIGNAFAMMEAKLVLATIAQHFDWTLAPGHRVVAERVFTLRPKDGVRLVLHTRQPVAQNEHALLM